MIEHSHAYHLVELRRGAIFNSGTLAEAKAAWSMGLKAEHEGPAYHSAFFFPDEVKKHVAESLVKSEKKKPSLAGYRGMHWAPYMVIDIDNHKEGQPELAKDQADDVLRVLVERYEVDPQMVLFCFSGNKGYHLYVPTAYFAPEPCVDFGRRIRHMVQHGIWPHLNATIFPNPKEVDWQIYDTLRCFRAVNSRHEKGAQLWKVPLTLGLFHEKTFAEVRELATGPCRNFPFPDWREVKPSNAMKNAWEASANWREDDQKDFNSEDRKIFDFSALEGADAKNVPDRRLCAMKLGQCDTGHGNRNATALMLISDMRERGLSPDETMELMRKWLALQKGTAKNQDYLATQIRYVYDDGKAGWGCFHPLAMANCFKQCRLFPQADADRTAADEWKTIEMLWDAYVERTKQPVYYNLPFGSLCRTVRLRSKQSNVFIGETGSGKTAIALEILRHNSMNVDGFKEGDPSFRAALGKFSLEMPGEELAERDGQFLLQQDQTYVENLVRREIEARKLDKHDEMYERMIDESKKRMRNVYFYDGRAVDLKRLFQLMEVGKERHGINFFVIDFLDRIRSRGINAFERIAPVVIEMKDMVRDLDVQTLLLVQVARASSEKGLGLRSGRGSGQIEENADNVFVYDAMTQEQLTKIRAPNKPDCRYMRLLSPKVRGGNARGAAVLEFYGKTMTFRDFELSAEDEGAVLE